MRIVIFLIAALILGCSKKSNDQLENAAATLKNIYSNDPLKNALVDTVILAKGIDTLVIREDRAKYVVYSAVINNNRFGIIAITDSTLFLLQKNKNNWVQTDSIRFENYAFSFQITDLNGDGLNDLMVNQSAYMHGNTVAIVFVADKKGYLKYVPSTSNLSNMEYDKEKGFIRSVWFGSAYGSEIKELYRWVDDSLQFYQSVKHDYSNPNGSTEVIFSGLKNGKIVETRRIKNPVDQIIYDTALFKID